MENNPLVSVLMTSYNREKYIAEAIESVLASTYTNFELIIVDDCSADATVSIAREYEAKDNRIKVFINETNLKDYPNRNRAASYAKGKYLKYLDSDDMMYPWGLYAMVSCMEKYPEAGYGLMSYDLRTEKKFPLLFSPAAAYYAFFFRRSLIVAGPSSCIISREAFERVGGFSGKPYLGDTELWLQLSKKYSLVAMPLDLIWWRQHEGQQIKDEFNNRNIEADRFILFRDSLKDEDCPLPVDYRNVALRNLKNNHARNIVKYARKGQITRSATLYKKIGFTLSDILKGVNTNKYPQPI